MARKSLIEAKTDLIFNLMELELPKIKLFLEEAKRTDIINGANDANAAWLSVSDHSDSASVLINQFKVVKELADKSRDHCSKSNLITTGIFKENQSFNTPTHIPLVTLTQNATHF